jgi:hypothetical protein
MAQMGEHLPSKYKAQGPNTAKRKQPNENNNKTPPGSVCPLRLLKCISPSSHLAPSGKGWIRHKSSEVAKCKRTFWCQPEYLHYLNV